MVKRISLCLCLVAAVTMIALPAFAAVQNVKVSGDLITKAGAIKRTDFQESRQNDVAAFARVKVDADLTDNVSTTIRLLNERLWASEQDSSSTTYNSATDVSIDLASVTLKEFLYSPLTLTIGRQELHFGNEMIIGDVDTNGTVSTVSPLRMNHNTWSLRKAFDAVRATFDYNPLVIDAIYAKINETTNLEPRNQVDLIGVNANYKLGGKFNTVLEAYYFGKISGKAVSAAAQPDKVHTFGGRIGAQLTDVISTSLEGAIQTGKYNVAGVLDAPNRRAFAGEAAVTFMPKKMKYIPAITGLAAYFSGDNHLHTAAQDNRKYTGWDPMFENQAYGDIANGLLPQTNMGILGGIGSIKPWQDITIKGEYYAYWFAKKSNFGTTSLLNGTTGVQITDKRFVGSEIDVTGIYDYTEDVQFSLLAGMLFPGAALAVDNHNIASEIVGTMKVTF